MMWVPEVAASRHGNERCRRWIRSLRRIVRTWGEVRSVAGCGGRVALIERRLIGLSGLAGDARQAQTLTD